MTVDCTNGHAVYPADHNAGTACGRGLLDGSTEVAPAMGQHFFLEMSDAEIEALPVAHWQKTILEAMARYGMFVGDTGGSGWGILIESASSFTSFGRPDPWCGSPAESVCPRRWPTTARPATRLTCRERSTGRASSGWRRRA